jgi:predicted phage baseplate assembly protein
MSPSADEPKLNSCGCCQLPPSLKIPQNPPGLSALSYRLGTHGVFLRGMLARIHSQVIPGGPNRGSRPLAALTTRSADDPAIALLDAWASVADVLTFYQERILNESYLRTATERRSVLELARSIGYELSPGVAAATFLAFTVDDAPGSPREAIVPAGTRVQSVPGPGKLSQIFETIEDIVARAECNALKPRLTRPQRIATGMSSVVFKGTTTNLKVGDGLLIAISKDPSQPLIAAIKDSSQIQTEFRRVEHVEADPVSQQTRVTLQRKGMNPGVLLEPFPSGSFSSNPVPFNEENVAKIISKHSWEKSDLNAFAFIQGWNTGDVFSNITAQRTPDTGPTDAMLGIFAFRIRASLFGYNAPDWKAMSTDAKKAYYGGSDDGTKKTEWPYPSDPRAPSNELALDSVYSQILVGSWAVVTSGQDAQQIAVITDTAEKGAADFTIGAKVTVIKFADDVKVAPANMPQLRGTVVHAQAEKLDLAELPIDDPIQDHAIELDSLYQGVSAGQSISVSGERDDAAGVQVSEVAKISAVTYAGGFTNLTLGANLTYKYKRATVMINANVALATHGETVRETLGSGDASTANQAFVLKKPPLTYVSAPTPSGAASTLDVRVNGILWRETTSLYGLGMLDESYTVRLDNDGKTAITFGDGDNGTRLPTGQENVTAVYRSGIGPDGEVSRGSLTLLQTRPLGVRSVNNPLAATGAAAPEDLDHARTNAPLKVLTLDRIVSLEDYENSARAFAGIGKAQAMPLWSGESQIIHLTVAAATGGPVDPNSSPYVSLVRAIDSLRDPVQRVQVASYQPLLFNLTASVLVDSRYPGADVLAAVTVALKIAFSFNNRAFAQSATAAEVVTIVQSVPGVIATDLTQLYFVTDADGPHQTEPAPFLLAAPARSEGGQIQRAQLLLLNPGGITLTEMKT